MKRYRQPKDKESKRNPLFHLVLEAVTAALCRPSRPDSSRQEKTRRRVVERKQARVEKTAPVLIVAPPDPPYRDRDGRFWW